MAFGNVPGVGGHPLFVPIFFLATLANYLAVIIPGSLNGQGIMCDDIPTQEAFTACLDSEYVRADSQMKAMYQRAVAALATDTAQRAALVRSQRAWIAYRDAQRGLRDAFASGENPHGAVMGSMIAVVWKRSCFLSLLAEARYPPPEQRCRG